MKKYILLIILFCGFTAQAQYGYGNGTRQRQRQMPQAQQEAPEPDFPIEKYLGIVNYDIKKAAKKTSIKLSSKKGIEFSKILTTYNKDIKDIIRINSFLIRSTKDMVDNFQKLAMKSGDFSNQTKVQKKMVENLKPISLTLKEEDVKLYAAMKELLSEKQYKKWLKYNKKRHTFFKKEE
ncbi:hypothetical protein [Polaribacter sp. Hel1_85]|uniref:hypothetical protein n=1 Tax=Polaribacter sp. Hel1_85 TaxID=1250005 RepID=UPI00052CA70F|nr:hypothetical protein [Polaribacter sp. Hel1_85]KGL62417.1 hypothetical protein PHEL85_2211 [Polaribacter sp. Hel1_85]